MIALEIRDSNSIGNDTGTATCIVVRRRDQVIVNHYLMSCLHVYGLLNVSSIQQTVPAQVLSNNQHIATYRGLGGSLNNTNTGIWSFDVALAEIESDAILNDLRARFNGLPFATWNALDTWPSSAIIHATRRENNNNAEREVPITAQNLQLLRGNQQVVRYSNANPPFNAAFRLVVKYRANTLPGDSGSPVTAQTEFGPRFLGIHIASDGQGEGYMLPAEEIINNAHLYIRGLDGDRLSLI
ncbi:hypothetical protein AltI4_08730 [Alteromonas sp. I4]|nr:hypothetical protein AltI4_08730 [Alteromonas sp. I4]